MAVCQIVINQYARKKWLHDRITQLEIQLGRHSLILKAASDPVLHSRPALVPVQKAVTPKAVPATIPGSSSRPMPKHPLSTRKDLEEVGQSSTPMKKNSLSKKVSTFYCKRCVHRQVHLYGQCKKSVHVKNLHASTQVAFSVPLQWHWLYHCHS